MKTYESAAGERISETCKALERMVIEHDEPATAIFNGVMIAAQVGMTAGDLERAWREETDRQGAEYRESPEYKKQQEEMKRRDEARKTALQEALRAAGPMEFSDEDAWKGFIETNADPYGGRVVRYASEWARLMQTRIANGETIDDCADELSHLADDDGITGFMYGCAVAVLSKTWKHGEDLWRWHNAKTQI